MVKSGNIDKLLKLKRNVFRFTYANDFLKHVVRFTKRSRHAKLLSRKILSTYLLTGEVGVSFFTCFGIQTKQRLRSKKMSKSD